MRNASVPGSSILKRISFLANRRSVPSRANSARSCGGSDARKLFGRYPFSELLPSVLGEWREGGDYYRKRIKDAGILNRAATLSG
jgi:hypothetical protein